GRSADAVAAFRQLVALSPEDWDVARPRYVMALLQNGQVKEAAAQLQGSDQKSRKVPAQIYLYQARIAALEGRFDDADKALTNAAQFIPIPDATHLEINL